MSALKMKSTLSSLGILSRFCGLGALTLFGLSACSATAKEGIELPEFTKGKVGSGDGSGSTGEQQNLEEARTVCGEGNSKVGSAFLRRLTRGEVEVSLKDVFNPKDWAGVRLSPDASSHLGFTNDAAVLVVGGTTAKEMLKTAEDVAAAVVADLETALPCAASSADRSCVEEFVTKYGLRLFRRPPTEEDIKRYADFQESVAGRSDFDTGMRWMITSMIQSPYTFYRSEIGVKGDGGRELDNFEMASLLAYMMVGSTPDDELLEKAQAGELSDPAVRRAQAERLLSSHPRQLEAMQAFFNEWLHYRTVLGKSRDDNPDFAEVISPLMVDETRLFLDTLVFGDRGSVRDLMTANYTALNGALSAHYGFGDVTGEGFEKAERPADRGMGVLAQGSLLAATSHQTATSPTLRGLLFTERFLCMEPPPPPAVVPTIESTNADNPVNTTREKYEVNHGAPGTACGTCHLNFEPYGYNFEHFDEMGVYRADEDGFDIDTAVTNAPMPDGTEAAFADLNELSLIVDSGNDVQNCVTGLLTAYAFSGGGGTACLAEDARAKAISGEISIYEFMLSMVEAPHFSRRL